MEISLKHEVVDDVCLGDYYIYLGNNRQENKYIFKLVNVDVFEYDDTIELILENVLDTTEKNWELIVPLSQTRKIPFCNIRYLSIQQKRKILHKKVFEYLEHNGEMYYKKDFEFRDISTVKYPTDPDIIIGTTVNKQLKEVSGKNLSAVKIAARLKTGSTLNELVLTKVKPQLPMMARGYTDHPFANIIAANIVSFGVSNFLADNTKAVWAAEAMVDAAMTDLVNKIDFTAMLKEIMEQIPDLDEEVE